MIKRYNVRSITAEKLWQML